MDKQTQKYLKILEDEKKKLDEFNDKIENLDRIFSPASVVLAGREPSIKGIPVNNLPKFSVKKVEQQYKLLEEYSNNLNRAKAILNENESLPDYPGKDKIISKFKTLIKEWEKSSDKVWKVIREISEYKAPKDLVTLAKKASFILNKAKDDKIDDLSNELYVAVTSDRTIVYGFYIVFYAPRMGKGKYEPGVVVFTKSINPFKDEESGIKVSVTPNVNIVPSAVSGYKVTGVDKAVTIIENELKNLDYAFFPFDFKDKPLNLKPLEKWGKVKKKDNVLRITIEIDKIPFKVKDKYGKIIHRTPTGTDKLDDKFFTDLFVDVKKVLGITALDTRKVRAGYKITIKGNKIIIDFFLLGSRKR